MSDSVSLRRGLLSLFDTVSHCVVTLKDKVDKNSGYYHDNTLYYQDDNYDSDELDYSGGMRRKQKLRPLGKRAHYSLKVEYPTQPGYGVNRGPQAAKGGYISRTKEGKFVLEDETDEGGFEMELPPNRFRTRSVAIVAGYSPERLYSNMPPGAFVVESGVYKVGADRDWERSEPIYWKQVVFGARNGSDGSGTMPRRRVGRLVEEDIQRLRAMEQPTKLITQANLELKRQSGSTARLRASSPITEQNAPNLIDFASPGSEISTVPHPSSAEHGTLLTNSRGFSSISSPNFDGTSSSRSLRALQKSSTLGTETTQLGTIHEQSVSYAEMNFPTIPMTPQQMNQHLHHQQQQFVGPPNPNFATVRADVHTRPVFNNRKDDLYWQRSTYRNADAMFPNYALNYPAPIHHLQYQGNISPSIQYPDTVMPKYREEALMYHLAAMQTTPLATSSPPIGHRGQQPQPQQPPPHDLGLPFKTSTRTSLHDYENMRYPVKRRRSNHSSLSATSRPPSDEFGRLNRESSVIDGELLKRPPTSTSADRASSSASGQNVRSSSQPDAVSLVSEVLDAEVTALTNSSPGSSNGSTERKSSSASKAAKNLALLQQARKNLTEELSQETRSSSSGIASKNSSQNQNQTTSSSLSTSSGGLLGASNTTSSLPLLSIDTSTGGGGGSGGSSANKNTGLEPIPESSSQHTYVYYDNLPFYENWPPPKQYPPKVRPRLSSQQQQHAYLGYQFVPPPEAASAQLLPPLTPHQSLGQIARPQHPSSSNRPPSDRKNDSPGVVDTSLDTPPSNPGAGQGSRPGSAHSAPLLDLSIDRHYEFDAARTPTDDIGIHHLQQANQPILLLPQNWNRPYLGYNPRRDRELGAAAAAAKQDRVFSDSEIYSPVFPRGRPEPRVDITARVQAMKKEFAEYRQQQQELLRISGKPSPSPPSGEPLKNPVKEVPEGTHLTGRMSSPLKNPEKLESLI